MDGRQSDGAAGGGQQEEVEDEFACAGMLRGSLLSLHGSVERIFGVSFGVGMDEGAAELPHSNNGQIWLQLRGPRSNVTAAKLFVRGVVNQEQQQEVSYPGVLHCVFCGARGLFMDCLIKNASAHIVVGSPGCLLISGLTEPVVRAYSLITDLVERYEGTQGRRAEMADRSFSESLDSRRAFKALVEQWEDRHTLDLLVLPGAVKETLLDLVKESGLGSSARPGDSGERDVQRDVQRDAESQRIWDELKQRQLLDGWAGTGGVGAWKARETRDVPSSAAAALPRHSDSERNPDVRQRHTGLFQNSPQQAPLSVSPPAFGTERWGDGGVGGLQTNATAEDPFFRSFSTSRVSRGRAEGSEAQQVHSPQEVGEEGQPEEVEKMEEEGNEEEGELLLSVGSKKEFGLLLKFFTAMGYTEGVVRRVLGRTGPKEASQVLDLIQQEQDGSGWGPRNQEDPSRPNRREQNRQETQERIGGERNLPSETEHREGEEASGRDGSGNAMRGDRRVGVDVGEGARDGETNRRRSGSERGVAPDFGADASAVGIEGDEEDREAGEGGSEDDFVLGVLKRAAASCGYMEEKVAEVYSMLPDLSTHQLLLELQREGARETETRRTDSGREGPREVDEVASAREGEEGRGGGKEVPAQPVATRANEVERKREEGRPKEDQGGTSEVPNLTAPFVEADLFPWDVTRQPQSHALHQTVLPRIRGPPLSAYPPNYNPQFPNTPIQVPQTNLPTQPTHSPKQPFPQPAYLPNPEPQPAYHLVQPPRDLRPTYPAAAAPPLPPPSALGPHPVTHPVLAGSDSSSARARDRRGFPATPPGAVVTGEQRFLEGLQAPFDLRLTDDPGDAGLRMIIIDGSNVAMSHGLGHFFSCRGIALAVQHFWNRGHRRISIFLPQWRQKRDPKTKEQHFLTELQNLGLLSYTPSREVQGKRINSYDDRFMLQLAQKTDGVIVTNDNLRDLLDESHVWRDIIKKRLLQYTFVGDHFMVPDDPLGRGGPHLDNFLRSQDRPPDPGHHSFAGTASPSPFPSSAKHPRSQTEVLHFRDRTPGGSERRGAGPGPGAGSGRVAERSAAETARLRESLRQVFPGQESMVTLVLQTNPAETDINSLSFLILEQQGD